MCDFHSVLLYHRANRANITLGICSSTMNILITKFPRVFSITVWGRRPFWSETNELRAAIRAWNPKLKVGGGGRVIYQRLPDASSRWTARLKTVSGTAFQTKQRRVMLVGERSCVSIWLRRGKSHKNRWRSVRKGKEKMQDVRKEVKSWLTDHG